MYEMFFELASKTENLCNFAVVNAEFTMDF